MPTASSVFLAGRAEQIGVMAASAVVPQTFARSLTPRSWIDQGVVTGLTAGSTYLLTVLAADSLELVASTFADQMPAASGEGRQRQAAVVTDLAVGALGMLAQRRIRRLPDEAVLRGMSRQVAWRTTTTAALSAALAGVQSVAAVLDDAAGGRGYLTRLPYAVPTGLVVALVADAQRQRAAAPDEDVPGDDGSGPESMSKVRSLSVAAGFVAAVTAGALVERTVAGAVGHGLAAVLPGGHRLYRLVGHGGALAGLAAVGTTMYHRVIHKVEAGAVAADPRLDALSPRLAPQLSGSADSLVAWESLGREGRRHAVLGVRPTPVANRPEGFPDLCIETVMQEPVRAQPVQVYVGLDNGATAAERVGLAMAEMDRAGAWDRSLLMLVSPTGTGYVNYVAVAAAQYLTRGDVATVTMQYSKRPSPLSLGKVKGAREQNRLLWLRILQRVRELPAQQRPRVVVFGESLGAHTSQDAFLHWGTLGPVALGIDRALWIGTPYGSGWMRQVTSAGRRDDVDDDLVAMVNDFGQVAAMPAQRRDALRYVLLSHDNDGVTKFGADLVSSQPRWLGDDRPRYEHVPPYSPRGIPAAMRWRPVTTFFQTFVDMKNAQIPGAYRAHGHDYRPDLARFVRLAYDLDCSEEQLVRVEDALAERERVREWFFSQEAHEAPAAQPATVPG